MMLAFKPYLLPMESTSSMKMMDGACSLAITNNSRTIREPSPMYFCTSSEPDTRMKQQSVWCATARASKVLPVPAQGEKRNTVKQSHTKCMVIFED